MLTVKGEWTGRLVRARQGPCSLRCRACGAFIPPRRGAGRRRRYCSPACKQRAYRQRRRGTSPRTTGWHCCVWCGSAFTRQHAYGPAPRFCSQACLNHAKSQRQSEVVSKALYRLKQADPALYDWAVKRCRLGAPLPVCPICGDIFFDQEGRPGRPRVYCSDRCRWHAHDLRWRECPVCLQWYDRMDSRGRLTRRYCSPGCKNKARHRRHRGQPIADWQVRALPGHEDPVQTYPFGYDDEADDWF